MDVDDARTPAEMVTKNNDLSGKHQFRCEALGASWYQAAALTRIATALEIIAKRFGATT